MNPASAHFAVPSSAVRPRTRADGPTPFPGDIPRMAARRSTPERKHNNTPNK